MDVRPLAVEDRETWLRLWRGYQIFYEAQIPEAVSAVTWQRLLDPAEPMGGAIARDEQGEGRGLVHWIFHRSCWTIGDYCYLQDLFVDPQARGGGIGTALIDHVASLAAERGCDRVHWLTQEGNASARRLYDRIADRTGFIQYKIQPGKRRDPAF